MHTKLIFTIITFSFVFTQAYRIFPHSHHNLFNHSWIHKSNSTNQISSSCHYSSQALSECANECKNSNLIQAIPCARRCINRKYPGTSSSCTRCLFRFASCMYRQCRKICKGQLVDTQCTQCRNNYCNSDSLRPCNGDH